MVTSSLSQGCPLVNSVPKVSAPQLTFLCACVILPWLSPSTGWFWKISSALVFIVVFWCMSAGASSSAHDWHAWFIMISVGAVPSIMIGGGGLRVPLPCCSSVQCWGCGSTRSSCPWSCPTFLQSHVPAAMLACDEVLSFKRYSGCRHFHELGPSAHWNGEFFASHRQFLCWLLWHFSCLRRLWSWNEEKCQRCVPAYWCLCFQRFSLTGWDCGSVCSCLWVLLHVLCRLPGRKACGSSMETWCVCVHLLCRRCLRLCVCLRPDRKPCGGSCVCERLQPGRKPCSSSIVCWCVSVHLLCRRCLRLCRGVVSGLCGWFLAFCGHVLGIGIKDLCCVSVTHHSCLGGGACPLIGAEQNDCGAAAAVDALRLACSLSVAAGASEDLLSLVDSGVHDCEFDREDRPNTAGCLSVGTRGWASGRVDVPAVFLLMWPMSRSSDQQHHQQLQRVRAFSSVSRP